jgi:general secretion pathway protein J
MSSPAKHFNSDGGFTLIEMLVAIALLATIAAMVFGSLITTNRVIEAGRDLSAREQAARRVLRVMAEEISLSKQDSGFQWVGMNGTQEAQPADTLAFLAVNDGSGGPAARESETIRVVYTREGDRLIRFAKKNLYGLTDESLDQVELANRVKGFNIRYFDAQSRAWRDEWPGANKMPTALLIEVTFQPPDVEPWTVREWVTIEAS